LKYEEKPEFGFISDIMSVETSSQRSLLQRLLLTTSDSHWEQKLSVEELQFVADCVSAHTQYCQEENISEPKRGFPLKIILRWCMVTKNFQKKPN